MGRAGHNMGTLVRYAVAIQGVPMPSFRCRYMRTNMIVGRHLSPILSLSLSLPIVEQLIRQSPPYQAPEHACIIGLGITHRPQGTCSL